MRNAKRSPRARSAGFALQDLLFTVAVVSLLVGIGAGVYSGVRDTVGAEEQAQRMLELASDVRRFLGKGQGTYTGLTAARANALGLVRQPMRWDGTNIQDRWGNTVSIYGQGPYLFSITAGGAVGMSASDCAAVATKLSNSAYRVMVGSATVMNTSGANDGWVSGGSLYKEGLTVTQANLTTGCSQARPIVGATFLER